jgi:tetratricopeptide (TPR) repeat protein
MSSACPYPGLRPFERHETDIFFGREEHTDQLLERFEHTHFLAVVGPSGCGKSSLVRTGLLAGLETGLLLSTGASWRIAELRPGNQPFARLTDALLADAVLGTEYTTQVTSYLTDPTEIASFVAAGAHRAMLQAQLRRGPFSIHEILANALLPEHTRLLIVVDQFEEIFRYYQQGQEDEAAAFVSLLLASSQHPNVYVVLTMRSDFIGDCALFHGLPEAINQGLFLTPRLNREQLRAAIEEPAGVFGGKIAPTLVNRLLNDTGNNPDQLPVLQHALMRMWTMASAEHSATGEVDGGQGLTLTMDHYDRIGGLDTALSQHADEAYNELDPAQQHIAAMLFRSLSERGSDRRDTRRPVALSEVATLAQVPWPQVATVVEVFRQEGRSFLTPPAGKALEPDSVLDISHESLIRQWQRLQAWTTEEAEAAELYQRLEDSAGRWEKGHAALLRTPELEEALAWRASVQPSAAWAKRYGQHFDLAMRFLDASAAQQQAEQQQAEAARSRELRQARKQVTVLLLGLIGAIGLALWAYAAQQQATKAKAQAVVAQQQAESSEQQALASLQHAETMRQQAAEAADEAQVARARAEENFQQARRVVDDFLTQLREDKVRDVPDFQPVWKELMEVALKYYQGFVQQRSNDPAVQAELGRTYFRIGRITHELGSHAEALQAFDAAATIQQQLLEENPDHPGYLSALGHTYGSMGGVHVAKGDSKAGLPLLEKARTFQEKLVRLLPNVAQYQHELGEILTSLGAAYWLLGNAKEAEEWYNKSLEIYRDLVDSNPEESKYKIGLSQVYNNLAPLQKNEGRKNEARQSLQKSIEINEKLMQEYPKDRISRQTTLLAYMNLGTLQASLGDHEGAKLSLHQSINITTQLVQENPAIINYREFLAFSYRNLAGLDQSRLDEAIAVQQELLKHVPNDEEAWHYLGLAFMKQGKLEESVAAFQRQVEISPNSARAWIGLGVAFMKQGRLEESIAAFQRQVEISPDSAEAWIGLGSALWRQEKHDAAAAAFARGLEVQPKHLLLLSNDAELALVQGDKDRFRTRIAAALPQVTTKDFLFAILPFLVWLDNPTLGWDSVMTAIKKVEPGVTFDSWNFSTTERAIVRQDASTQQTAHHFIAFFTGQIDLPTLEERLPGR